MPIHMLHPHAHRRHYPHHLLDHFSGNLTQQSTALVSREEVVPPSDTVDSIQSAAVLSGCSEISSVAARVRDLNSRVDNNAIARENAMTDGNNNPASDDHDRSQDEVGFASTQQSQAWPFYGTESGVLPSVRKVSFLRQACLGFSRKNTKEQDKGEMETICPKAFREASFSRPQRRTFLCNSEKAKVTELRRRFTNLAKKSSSTGANMNKFEYETVSGTSFESSTARRVPPDSKLIVLDTDSTKGNHPIAKAPGLRSSCTPIENRQVVNQKAKVRGAPWSHSHTRPNDATVSMKPGSKTTSTSPTRKKDQKSTKFADPVGWTETSKSRRGSKVDRLHCSSQATIGKPMAKSDRGQLIHKTEYVSRDVWRKFNNGVNTRVEREQTTAEIEKSPTSSESQCECSLVASSEEIEDNVSNSHEDPSIDSEISQCNFLIDYGDPSRFYFRNEWDVRMKYIELHTLAIKEELQRCGVNRETLECTMDILNEVENVKQEMGELYDYFDHFEREEDTLLQQVQRQLMHANRYNKILQYRLDGAEHRRTDNERVKELMEELKLSRQVAVSLHWELQAADIKQEKLEKVNVTLGQKIIAAETARQALSGQVEKLQSSVDQMSLHAPSQYNNFGKGDNSNEEVSVDTVSEMKRQLQFLEEKEEIMLSRLADLQTEKDTLKDELQQYREQYGELASVSPWGPGRHTDLKLRLKLAEDQAGLLARKVIELQLENDNLTKLAAEKEVVSKEIIQRNPSVSDLQFLEDERESLRMALDEMEIENQKLAAELLRYKQAVHRQLHSNSSSTESSLDVGLMIRIPRSNESVFDEESRMALRSQKFEDKSSTQHDITQEFPKADRNKIRPLSLNSPSNQSQKKTKMTISRTLSDIAIPLSPDSTHSGVQATPATTTISTCTTPGTRSRKSRSQKSKNYKVHMVDAAVITDLTHECTRLQSPEHISEASARKKTTRSQATSPIMANLQNLFGWNNRVKTPHTKSQATSPVANEEKKLDSRPFINTSRMNTNITSSHTALFDKMRKQIACVRNIAESMDNVVDVKEMEAELERKGKKIVNAECKRIRERSAQKRSFSKIAKTLQKHINDMEESVSAVEGDTTPTDGGLSEIAGWNLHGNADISTNSTSVTSYCETVSTRTVRLLSSKFHEELAPHNFRIPEAAVLLIILYILFSSLPVSALFQIGFLVLVFFIC